MFEANEVTTIRPEQRLKVSSSRGPTPDSEGDMPGAVGVGGVAAQQQQPLAAQLGQPRDVGGHAVDRGLVELVVARQQRGPELAGQRDREGVGDRVGHLDHLDAERAGVEGLPRPDVGDLDVAQAVLVELGAHHRRGERAAVDGRRAVELAQHEGQRADVVLVPVGEHDRLDVLGPLAQVGEVGQHQVHPELVGRGEHQPGVDHHDAAVVLDDRHVLADLAEAPEREHSQRAAQTALSSPWRSSASRSVAASSSLTST